MNLPNQSFQISGEPYDRLSTRSRMNGLIGDKIGWLNTGEHFDYMKKLKYNHSINLKDSSLELYEYHYLKKYKEIKEINLTNEYY